MTKKFFALSAVALSVVFLSGCYKSGTYKTESRTKQVSYAKLDFNAADSRLPSKGSGISISMKPITKLNADQHPELKMDIPWAYSYNYIGRECSRRSCWDVTRTAVKKGTLNASEIAPLPVFEVKIANNTNHVLKFKNAVLTMEDNNGNMYDAMDKHNLQAFAVQSTTQGLKLAGLSAANIKGSFDKSNIYQNQSHLTMIDNNFMVLPGKVRTGYMAFKTGKFNEAGYEEFLMSKKNLSVQLYEIPVSTDAAGNVTKTDSYSFRFDSSILTKDVKYKVRVFVPDKKK